MEEGEGVGREGDGEGKLSAGVESIPLGVGWAIGIQVTLLTLYILVSMEIGRGLTGVGGMPRWLSG